MTLIRKRESDSKVEPPSKKRVKIESSAERPARRRAERSARGRDRPRIAYIYCPRYCWHRTPVVMSRAIENAFDVGSTIINLVFDHEKEAKLLKLEDHWNKKFATMSFGAVVSLYSENYWQLLQCQDVDPIGRSPCVMLTFNGRAFPDHQLTVIAVAFPALPSTVRSLILDACVESHQEQANRNNNWRLLQ